MKDDLLSINITLADRTYPMRIKRSEEENIRKAAKIINKRILLYQERYEGKDIQDFLAMSSLQFVIQVLELMDKNDKEPLINSIQKINKQLEEYLKVK